MGIRLCLRPRPKGLRGTGGFEGQADEDKAIGTTEGTEKDKTCLPPMDADVPQLNKGVSVLWDYTDLIINFHEMKIGMNADTNESLKISWPSGFAKATPDKQMNTDGNFD